MSHPAVVRPYTRYNGRERPNGAADCQETRIEAACEAVTERASHTGNRYHFFIIGFLSLRIPIRYLFTSVFHSYFK